MFDSNLRNEATVQSRCIIHGRAHSWQFSAAKYYINYQQFNSNIQSMAEASDSFLPAQKT